MVLNRRHLGCIWPASRLFVAPKLLFLCFGWVGMCIPGPVSMPTIHRQLGHSLLRAQLSLVFWSSSHIYILLAVGASSLLKEKRTVKTGHSRKNVLKHLHSFSLQPTHLCLICQETIAVMKISHLKLHYEMKNRNCGGGR